MARKATGHVRQRKANLWEGQYVFQRERRSICGRTRKEVEKELKQIVLSIERGECVQPNQHMLNSWLREWLETYAKPFLRPTTFLNYESIIERHISSTIGNMRLDNISTQMLQNFFTEKLSKGRERKAELVEELRSMHDLLSRKPPVYDLETGLIRFIDHYRSSLSGQ